MSGTFNIDQININITDVIPPENFATVDAGAKIGTVYTKAQDNEWRAEVEATTQSGIKGVLKPNTPYDAITNPYPTPWVAGNSPLYEKYDVNQAGPFPNTKDADDENINVTQNELDLNEVQIWVKNGVAQKVLKAMPQASVNVRRWVDLQPNDFPLTEGNQVVTDDGYFIVPEGKTAIAVDIPGESDNYKSLVAVTIDFEPDNEKAPQGGKQIYDFVIDNSRTVEKIITFNSFTENYGAQDGALVPVAEVMSLSGIPAKDVKSLVLTLTTHQPYHGLITVYGKKLDGTFAQIYDVVNTALTDFTVNIPQNTYTILYVNAQKLTGSSVKVIKEVESKIYADPEVMESLQAVEESLSYFVAENFENVSTTNAGQFRQGNDLIVYAAYNCIVYDAEDVYKVSLTMKTRNADDGIITFYGRKLDGTFENIFDMPSVQLSNFEIEIETNKYDFIYFNYMATSPAPQVKVFKKNVKSVQAYILENAGGGSGINIPNTVIYAESLGVSSANTASQNTTIINNISETNKVRGANIVLPAGVIKVANLEIWNTCQLLGAFRGGVLGGTGGTILEATQGGVLVTIKKFADNDTAQVLANMQLNGAHLASSCVFIGSGMAFFEINNISAGSSTVADIHTQGALIYTMRNLRLGGGSPTAILIESSVTHRANHIRLEMCQFASCTGVATIVRGGANVVFEQCDWEANGTTSNLNTGNVEVGGTGSNAMSTEGEGVDVTFNGCWSEYVSGGFWMKIHPSVGVVTIRDSMLWRLTGTAQKGIINNGCRLLLTGSTKINDFPLDIETSNNGETRVDGFAKIATHNQITGGTYKAVTYS